MNKTERNNEIKRLRYRELMTLQEIADIFGVSRERIRQIVGNTGEYATNTKRKALREYVASETHKTNSELCVETGVSYGTISSLRKVRHAVGVMSDTPPKIGYEGEEYIIDLLEQRGYRVSGMTYNHSYDILINGSIRADVKVSHSGYPTSPGIISPQYHFHVRKNRRADCDIYILVTLETGDVFIVPSKLIPNNMDSIFFCWPTKRPDLSKWQQYHNRFDILDDMLSRVMVV